MTSENKQIKEKFRHLLPRGYARQIREKLKKDHGISISQGKISQVCNPEKPDWDEDVILAALELAKQTKQKNDTIKTQIDEL